MEVSYIFQFWLQYDGSSGCFTFIPSYVSPCILIVTCLYSWNIYWISVCFQVWEIWGYHYGVDEDSGLLGYNTVLAYINQQFRGACYLSHQGLNRTIRVAIQEKWVYVLCKGDWSSSVTLLTGAVAPWFCQLHSKLVPCDYYPNHLHLYNIQFFFAWLLLYLDTLSGGSKLYQNVSNYLPLCTALYPRRWWPLFLNFLMLKCKVNWLFHSFFLTEYNFMLFICYYWMKS